MLVEQRQLVIPGRFGHTTELTKARRACAARCSRHGEFVADRIRTELEVIDERFRACQGDEWLERLYTGGRWTEGPAYFPAGRYLLFSDIPNDRMLRFDELTGAVGFRAPAGYSNGNTVDRQGRLVTLLGKLHIPEIVSNLTFGGPRRNDLFITATSSVYSLRLKLCGVRYPT